MYITHLAWNRVLYSDSDEVFRYSFNMRNGYSVKCIRDWVLFEWYPVFILKFISHCSYQFISVNGNTEKKSALE